MKNFTNKKIIEKLQKRFCCEYPIQHFCRDSCLYGIDHCEIALAIDALERFDDLQERCDATCDVLTDITKQICEILKESK